MNKDIEIAQLKALSDAIAARLKELKTDDDAETRELYVMHGVTERAIMIDGQRVGMRKICLTKPAPVVIDAAAFIDCAVTNGLYDLLQPANGLENVLTYNPAEDSFTYADTPLVVPGVMLEPSRVKCIQIRGCKLQDVADAMHINLAESPVYALLNGGESHE